MVARLFDGVVDARNINARRARLHLHLTPVNAWLIVEKMSGQPLTHSPPVEPERVGCGRDDHRAHPKIYPTRVLEHQYAGIHQWPACASLAQRGEVRFVPVSFTQAIVAAMVWSGVRVKVSVEDARKNLPGTGDSSNSIESPPGLDIEPPAILSTTLD